MRSTLIRHYILLLSVCFVQTAYAWEREMVWPKGKMPDAQPHQIAAMNSVKTWEKMRSMGIQSEVHTLATRNHCFQQMASPGTGSYIYLDRIGEFLEYILK